jgi:hypothetical protein
LAREAKYSEQSRRSGQLVDQPQLRGRLHPRSDERYELSGDKELEIAVLHRAEAIGKIGTETRRNVGVGPRRRSWVDRFAVTGQNNPLHLFDAENPN